MVPVFWSLVLLVAVLGAVKCQVNFPTNSPTVNNKNEGSSACNASNGSPGNCYEFRSKEFKNCSKYFPSIDSSNPGVASHLEANLCRNTGNEIYFCCPKDQRPDEIPFEKECGTSLRDNVVGGESTAAGDWPWLVALGTNFGGLFVPHCGGTLITKQHVISAAHCFHQEVSGIIVRLGEYNWHREDDTAHSVQDFEIVDRRMGDWTNVTRANDIILLKLDRLLSSFTDSIRAACLPYHLQNNNFEDKTLAVVGWGKFNNRINGIRGISPIPLLGALPVVSIRECEERYKQLDTNRTYTIDDRQLCAGLGGTDSCGGDSGGPLNYSDIQEGRFYVVGVVSFGPKECGSTRLKLPGVYTRVGHYLDWIEEKIKEMR